jgi:hypothetical protein
MGDASEVLQGSVGVWSRTANAEPSGSCQGLHDIGWFLDGVAVPMCRLLTYSPEVFGVGDGLSDRCHAAALSSVMMLSKILCAWRQKAAMPWR